MSDFLNPLIGGVIIGLAATVMLLFNGKISGISGILGGCIQYPRIANIWRYTFVLGLVAGGFLMHMLFPSYFEYSINASTIELIIGGVLVGFGTRLGSGCTSGHGVCGLPRKSIRSLVATLTFIGAGIVTVIMRGML